MTAAVIGALIGFAALALARNVVALRRPQLNQRIGQFLPGFRAQRGRQEFDPIGFLRASFRILKNKSDDKVMARSRRDLIMHELPDHLDLLAVASSAGETFYGALRIVNSRATGALAGEFDYLLSAIDMGSSLEVELTALASRARVRQVEEFANKVILAQRRGTPLARMLRDQATAVRAEIRNRSLARAGQNEAKMLIPLVFLILPTTVLFAVYPSLQLLNFNYL